MSDDHNCDFEITDDIAKKYTNHSTADSLFEAAGVLDSDDEDASFDKLDLYLKKFLIYSIENLIAKVTEDNLFNIFK